MTKVTVHAFVASTLLALSTASALPELTRRTTGGYVQNPSGSASFTVYSGCSTPACGIAASGFTAAISQLTFGAGPGSGGGDACGRCFAITATSDPYSPGFAGPFATVVVKATDLCPAGGAWCGQTRARPANEHGAAVHFDVCADTGGAAAFFPAGRGALLGSYSEVPCSRWSGADGSSLWGGACLKGEDTANWPATGCGNRGTAP